MHGVKLQDMRVSNVHHETAIQNLWYMQEVEPDLWNRITERLQGINTSSVLNRDLFDIRELPSMFKDWEEYRDYLLENLIDSEDRRERFRRAWNNPTARDCMVCDLWRVNFMKACIRQLLKNDFEGASLTNFLLRQETVDIRNYVQNGKITDGQKPMKYVRAYMKQIGKA